MRPDSPSPLSSAPPAPRKRRATVYEDVTVDAIIEGRVLYGSPETVAARLIEAVPIP